ncbi:MAG: dimethylamine corrinoid protein 3 [Actinobacteria bacterium]|nr:dimethylamine corrinoid protein 3 [Actinomycetota bacterium]
MADIYQEAAESIVNADRAGAEEVAKRALAEGISPADIMQKGFVKGIQEVGDLFESGEVFLPELMMSADAMAGATEVTNAALEGEAAEAKGTIVIGTVQGDVHDIGKAIVIAYLKANGYDVTDLGRDVSAETFIEKAKELNADVIGMSALLTTTMEEQKKVIKAIKDGGLSYKTVVGGAPCTQRWADQIGADAYAEDANDGVKKIDALLGK